MASKDLYSVLGVKRDASADEIRSAYRTLARKLHPDVNPGDAAAEARFKEVSAAYAVLSDDQKRKLYDEFGDVALQAGFDAEKAEQMRRWGGAGVGGGGTPFDYDQWSQTFFTGGSMDDLLGSILGGRFGRRGPMTSMPRRGADLRAELAIDLPLAVRGGTTTLRLDLPGRERVEVKIPPGIKDGQTLRLAGLGQSGSAGGPPGDLLIEVRVLEHPTYRRDGDDLHVEVPITLAEALQGATIAFEGPTGEVSLKVPPGTQSGRTFRLRGLGVPRRGGGRGNLYVRTLVVLPDLDGDAEARARLAALAEAAAPLYRDDVRVKVRFD